MLIFLDTEFTGLDQITPDLISIALVDETGREFYAELPPASYRAQLSEWSHENVVCHLWGGKHIQTVEQIRGRILPWITATQDRSMIVTNCPDADFTLLKRVLLDWPKNLAKESLLFNSWSTGDNKQPALEVLMARYFTPARPQHHALHDAHALRLGMMHALERGWLPSC
ncbi:3'-5' exoribonuclease domain-containing protein [Propionivibrio sp.]|uniref:3'-5' exoribonuclease domain-containing protein n=1 Tax=Propionivibrio sp. TaxID=2212460 RepID=UPI003BF2DEB0